MSLASLSPEAQLLLLTAGGEKNDQAIRALARAAARLGEARRGSSEQERATPVLWRRVSAIASLPEEAQPLHRMSMVSEFRMSHLESRLLSALDTLAEAEIEPVLLKGAALALTVYGSFVARPMSDVDLLVPRDDATARARRADRVGMDGGRRGTRPSSTRGIIICSRSWTRQGTGTSARAAHVALLRGASVRAHERRHSAPRGEGDGARAHGAGAERARSAAASLPALRVVAHDGHGCVARVS